MDEKPCVRCGDTKPLEDFHRDNRRRDGRGSYCKSCGNAVKKGWRDKNPEKVKRNRRKHYRPEKDRDRQLRRNFGITLEEYERQFMLQGGLCAVCGEPFGKGDLRPCVDHDHSKEGRESVRGIVHQRCNLLVAVVESKSDLLEKAAEYLRVTETETLLVG